MKTPTIKVGNTLLWLDAEELNRKVPRFTLEGASLSDQCDGCGEDIYDTAHVDVFWGHKSILCKCGQRYEIFEKDVG